MCTYKKEAEKPGFSAFSFDLKATKRGAISLAINGTGRGRYDRVFLMVIIISFYSLINLNVALAPSAV